MNPRHPNPPKKRNPFQRAQTALCAAFLGLTALACDGASLDVKLVNPSSITHQDSHNAFAGVTELEFKAFDADTKEIHLTALASYDAGKVSLDGLPTDTDLRLRVTAFSNGSPVSWGESSRFRLPEGPSDEKVAVRVVLRPVNTWSPAIGLDGETQELVQVGMSKARAAHTATLLDDGRVLFIGGFMQSEANPAILNSAEIFDPASGERLRFNDSQGGDVGYARRAWHTATKIPSGDVIVAGGVSYISGSDGSTSLNMRDDVSRFSPSTLAWSDAENMSHTRSGHTASFMSGGKDGPHVLLFFGGWQNQLSEPPALSSSPVSSLFNVTAQQLGTVNAPNPRTGHAALSVLGGAYAVILGGMKADGTADTSVLIYSPTGLTQSADKSIDRTQPAAVEYSNSILVMGGRTQSGETLRTTQLIPLNDKGPHGNTPDLLEARSQLCAEKLLTGDIIAAGGKNASGNASNTVDLFVPAEDGGLSRMSPVRMSDKRYLHTCTVLENGQLLVSGGIGQAGSAIDSLEIYTPNPTDYPQWQ